MSSLLWVDDSQLELIFSLYSWIANYQIVMISFINSNSVVRSAAGCAGCQFHVFVFFNLSWKLWWALLWFFLLSYFLVIRRCYSRCVVVVFCDISWVICYLSCWYCFDKQRHLAGNFRGVRGRLCWIFKFRLRFFLVSAGVSFQIAYCRAICFFALVEIWFVDTYLNIYLCFSCVFIYDSRLLNSNNFLFVSVIPVGASDRLAGLLIRTWWQGWDWTRDLTAISSMVPLWVFIGNRL